MPHQIDTQELIHDESPIAMPTGLEFRRGDTNRRLLRAAWKAVGLQPRYPLDTNEVLSVLKLMGYNLPHRRLRGYLQRGYVTPPPKSGKDFRWEESNIVALADSLESTRDWLPLHPCHVHKLDDRERIAHALEAAKRKAAIEHLTQQDPSELISMMTRTNNEELREWIGIALSAQTGSMHRKGSEQPTEHATESN